jgi:CubicO group peptidase (beta-lactamase class C family)
LAAVVLACGFGLPCHAQNVTAEHLRNKPWQSWNQQELVYGLGHFDEVFPGRIVEAGKDVTELYPGPPMAAFAKGTPGATHLHGFIAEQQVAGLLILQDGRIRLEYYGLGQTASARWTSQSVAKSVTSTLVGIALREGSIRSLADPVSSYVTGLKGSVYDDVTVRQLLTMTSGVRWTEDYTDPQSDLGRLYATAPVGGLSVASSYMRTLARAAEPGTGWVYKTGETHLLGDVVRAATGQSLAVYLSEKIWKPYGMEADASWGFDGTGAELAGCCLQATLRDYGRIGQFVLDGANVDGASVVPVDWFAEATTSQVEFDDGGNGYGYQWWTRGDGSFSAIGIYGQLGHVDPSRRLVVVLNSAWPEATSEPRSAARAEFLALVKAALDEEGP